MKTATEIENKILFVMDKYGMVGSGDTVIVAVSGGADSMCLLHFFNKISSKRNFNIICAHVNHGIRGAEADRDESFVRDFCEKNSIEFRAAHYNVPEISSKTGESEEECGRRLRYGFFSSICENAKIATAHHLNDSIETAIFNLARGTGLKGLTGIPAMRGNIIRPLIECTREETEYYLKANNIDYITDSTNLKDDYSRNAVRHNVIPVLKKINPSFESVFLSCTEVLTDTESYLEKVTDAEYERLNKNMRFSVSDINALDSIIRSRLIKKIAESFGAKDVSFKHISLAEGILTGGGAVNLHGNVTFCSDGKNIYKRVPQAEIRERSDISSLCVPFDEKKTVYEISYTKVTAETIDKKDISIYNIKELPRLNFCDADKLKNAVFRTRRSGDRFRFPNAGHSKSLKNLFSERGIPAEKRYNVIILADENNILWIDGIGVSDFAKVTDKTKKVIKISAES